MKRTTRVDPFFYDQPEKTFLEALTAPIHAEKPLAFGQRSARAEEADVRGMYIAERFPENEELLVSSYTDFSLFLDVCEMAGERYPLRLRKVETPVFEAYSIAVSATETVVTANDAEGIRRALIYLEDEMQRLEGPYLPLGRIERRPHMAERITRCFFSPINRPPKYGDELTDDIDYYPEEYLNRLMHDGANGVWIYTRFSDLIYSSYLPDYGKGSEARIKKLNRVIEKCTRYGVRPYVFAIEPYALTPEQSALLPELDGGVGYNGNHLFCVSQPKGRAIIEECGRRLFEACPGLGGFISITYGERPTTCSSVYLANPAIGFKREMTCPRCRNISPGQELANSAAALASGIHQVKPEAHVISWTYGHRSWDIDSVLDYVRRAPDDAILMENFEDMGLVEQLGRTRLALDYWLSYPGPSPLFRAAAEEAARLGKRMFMKTQVCCSHEVATVPYIPAPGILFDRYRAAHALKVQGAMQCWYFGNYPSMMSKAATELAFEHEFADKHAFLVRLAGIYWGESRAETIAQAWEAFEAGYTQYPVNVMFSYYGPMHDGPVWKLHLKPKNFSLSRSWLTLDPPDGDRIGESLMAGHTLDEAILLAGGMAENWRKGIALMRSVAADDLVCTEQLSVAEALDVLFDSGRAILNFYRLREMLGLEKGDAKALLAEMRQIVLDEMDRSRRLIALCEKDGRLGYHSEGEGYKYFPKKLLDRIEYLKELLHTEFVEVENRVANGLAPLAYYAGEDLDDLPAYTLRRIAIEQAEWENIGKRAAFRAVYDDKHLVLELRSDKRESFHIAPEFRLMWPSTHVYLTPEGELKLFYDIYIHQSVFGDVLEALRDTWSQVEALSGEGTHLRITLDRQKIGWEEDTLFKMNFSTDGETLWCPEEDPIRTLGKSCASPRQFGWFLPEKG